MPLGLHNIHYNAQSDLANREVGERRTRSRATFVAQSSSPVNPFFRSSAPTSPVLFPLSEALCVDVSSRPAIAVPCWRRLRAHSYELRFRNSCLMFLKCTTCGRETAGWALNAPPPRLRFAGDPRRHIGWLTKPPRSGGRS